MLRVCICNLDGQPQHKDIPTVALITRDGHLTTFIAMENLSIVGVCSAVTFSLSKAFRFPLYTPAFAITLDRPVRVYLRTHFYPAIGHLRETSME